MIHKLSDTLISQIAAGEVIVSPVEALKELVENSIDARAARIEIFIFEGGLRSLQVRDDGTGIAKEDLALALESFATSKIDNVDDLFHIHTMGFRGEALSSIRSVSSLSVETRHQDEPHGWKITGEGDAISLPEPSPLPQGTRIVIENLFFNVPIRKKFLKKEKTLHKEMAELVSDYALVHPQTAFYLEFDGKVSLDVKPAKTLTQRIEQLYGHSFSEKLTPAFLQENGQELEGYLSNFYSYHGRSNFIRFFVNARPVDYRPLVSILRSAYGELLPPGKFPAAFLFLTLPPDTVDVNVHPRKKEIRFREEKQMDAFLRKAIAKSIEGAGAIPVGKLGNLNKAANRPWNHDASGQRSPRPFSESSAFSSSTVKAPAQEQELDFQTPLILREGFPSYHTDHSENDAKNTAGAGVRLPKPRMVHTSLFDTIIVATSPDSLYLIDQHTAHERIQYERFLSKLKSGEAQSQALASSHPVQLTAGDRITLEAHRGNLMKIGFSLEDLGPAGFAITGIPAYLKAREAENALQKALAFFEMNPDADLPALFDHVAKSLACRSAVKKGENLPQAEYMELIEQLFQCQNPARCPHGRPTVISMNRDDIFALFKR